jgi:hypothetical protein
VLPGLGENRCGNGKESEMFVLSQPKNESTVIAENTSFSSNWGPDSGFRWRIATMSLQNGRTSPRIRMEKVLAVRQQLAEGGYDMDKRLDAVLDRLLETLKA